MYKRQLLHQAAKNAFDEMGVKKLPKVKELQTEYVKLLEEKKKTYQEHFPLLIKMNDVSSSPSLQVHPDDAYAQAHEHATGKSEFCLYLKTAPNLSLIHI